MKVKAMSDNTSHADLATVNSDVLSTPSDAGMSVGGLERALLSLFPAGDAEPWDRTGMIVGDPAQAITGVAVALDATATAVAHAVDAGANVLLTHHPVFIDPPEQVAPLGVMHRGAQAAVWAAVSQGVALMNFHTALDVSEQAQQVLPSMLGFVTDSVLEQKPENPSKGYGQVCQLGEPLSLEQLAARCLSVFGRVPRVWGNMRIGVSTVVTATGSGGSLIDACLQHRVDCLVCGELRYHDALSACEAGLCLVELGHDVSELPLCAVLAAAAEQVGVRKDQITILDQTGNWWTPEAMRR